MAGSPSPSSSSVAVIRLQFGEHQFAMLLALLFGAEHGQQPADGQLHQQVARQAVSAGHQVQGGERVAAEHVGLLPAPVRTRLVALGAGRHLFEHLPVLDQLVEQGFLLEPQQAGGNAEQADHLRRQAEGGAHRLAAAQGVRVQADPFPLLFPVVRVFHTPPASCLCCRPLVLLLYN
jgi:hypothetical protein